MYVLDSDVIIDVAHDAPRARAVMKTIGEAPAATTSVSMHEILVGVPERLTNIYDAMLRGMQIISHDENAARHGAKIQQALKNAPLSSTDAMIAGICLAQDATLVSFDKSFRRVKGLRLIEL
ncbi:type II toxin-antitoxin system VapC family toxin [Candidatus Woesearchaeota archaeon]|nr:type II toxin-antitoxin system VapC family toxin [Candidatus Woesearchaeota archaeon]